MRLFINATVSVKETEPISSPEPGVNPAAPYSTVHAASEPLEIQDTFTLVSVSSFITRSEGPSALPTVKK